MGNKNISPRAPRMYLYHAYLSFMEVHGFERPLTLTKFGESLPKIMLEYRKVQTNKGYSYNVELSGEAEEWLPSVPELRNSQACCIPLLVLGLHSLHHFKYLSVFKRNNRCIYSRHFKVHV
ncbi:Poxvirus D5 protein-like protein [Photorhabdus australis subsp. thailandensis]|uniref:Poxvirus D5 protein-like protein n=1 Tax=Photorhabdus australis subsp. thailandensis TaxID=2805096 RepID=A0A1C0U6E7_9GAMM|nr:Poxvirus D5 protein-like protein [Photorhabdus australis subsp. thailandensis]